MGRLSRLVQIVGFSLATTISAMTYDAAAEAKKEPAIVVQSIMADSYKPKYDTTAHEFVRLEGFVNLNAKSYQVIDDIIDDAKQEIPQKPFYSEKEVMYIFSTIDEIIKSKGYVTTIVDPGPLGKVLTAKEEGKKYIDCDSYTALYLGISDVLNLSLKPVRAPLHVYVRWVDSFNPMFPLQTSKRINWEPTMSKSLPDIAYVENKDIDMFVNKSGIYNRTLSKKQFMANALNNRGAVLVSMGQYAAALFEFSEAVERDPNNPMLRFNVGLMLGDFGRFEEAISEFSKVLELNEYYANAYWFRAMAYRQLGKHEAAEHDQRQFGKILEQALPLPE